MKYLITIVTFFLVSSTSILNKEQKADLMLLCDVKWHIEYMEVEGMKAPVSSEPGEESWMIFHKDGRHEIMSIGKKFSGKWEYQRKSNSLLLTDDTGVTDQEIEKLTKNELILSFTFEGTDGKLFLVNKTE